MQQKRLGTVLIVLFGLAGGLLSGSLLGVHMRGHTESGILASVCGGEGEGCDKVIHSRWGVFPPGPAETKAESAPEDAAGQPAEKPRTSGIPVAALGLFYFTFFVVWFGAIGWPGGAWGWARRGLIAVAILGCLGSAGFIGLMKFAIGAWCPLCLGVHVSNFALLGCLIGFRPRGSIAAVAPAPRVVGLTLVLFVVACVAEWQMARAGGLETEGAKLRQLVDKYRGDAYNLELSYLKTKKIPDYDKWIRDDDPIIEAKKGVRNTVILFSDVECPSCSRFDRFLFGEVVPLFNGHLRVVYKHLPLTGVHPNALEAAKALEAARLQGKERFWEMHDLLLENRTELATVSYSDLAAKLGLDPVRFVRDMRSRAVANRIAEDQKLAATHRFTSTPTVVLNGRVLDKIMKDVLAFWRLRAAALKRYWGDKW